MSKFCPGNHFWVLDTTPAKIFSRISDQITPVAIELMGERKSKPRIIPKVQNAIVPRRTLTKVFPSSARALAVNQALVVTLA